MTVPRYALAAAALVLIAVRRRAARAAEVRAARPPAAPGGPRVAEAPPPAVRELDALPPVAARRTPPGGWLPALSLASAGALLVVAAAHALSRSGREGGSALFWLAVLGLVLLAAFRLASTQPTRGERIGVVVLVGMALYLVKVLKDPFVFTYSDEFVHAYNAVRVLDSGFLLSENPIIGVTAQYTGLATATSAVGSLTGLGVFGSGIVVVGAARLLMTLALFLLFEEVSRSPRVAALGTLLYVANPNYLFFSAQYAYESLALPLLVLALAAVARWMRRDDGGSRRAWGVAAAIAIAAVVMTHHMTTYGLLGFLVAFSLAHLLVGRGGALRNPWPFAVLTAAAMVAWLVFVASDTAGYITLIFTRALESAVDTILRETEPRRLFVTESGYVEGPVAERVVGLASVALIGIALLLGLREIRRRYRTHPLAVALAVVATAYLGTLLLRFVPNAWEVGARASEFLFIGVAFVLALACSRAVDAGGARLRRAVAAGAAAFVVAGGIITGWPHDVRLGLPYRITASGDEVLEPEGSTAARWTVSHLGVGETIGADETNARLLLLQRQRPLTGSSPNVGDVLLYPTLAPFMVDVLTANDIRYVVMDRRRVRDDKAVGYFFASRRAAAAGRYPRTWSEKLDRQPGASRIYDSGDLAIYDVGGVRYDPDRP